MPRAKTPKTPKNGNARSKSAEAASGHNGHSVPAELEVEIRTRAYELYAQRGFTDGHQDDDWLVAEQEVKTRHAVAGA